MDPKDVKKKRVQPTVENWRKRFIVQGECGLDFSKLPTKRRPWKPSSASTKIKSRKAETASSTDRPSSYHRSENSTANSEIHQNIQPLSGDVFLEIGGESSEDCRLYLFSIFQGRGCVFLDKNIEVCALMDWNSTDKTLSNVKPIIVQKMPQLGYACSCDSDRHYFMNKVRSCTSEDVEELYAGCIHVEAAKELCRKFKNLYSVEENSEEITVSEDHRYSEENSCTQEKTLCQKLNWGMENTYAIRTDNHCHPFAIIGFSYGKLKCLSCQRRCEHLQDLEKLLENPDFYDNSDLFELFTAMAKTPEASNIYSLKTLSTAAIPFNLTAIQKENLCKNITDVLIEEDGILKIIPTDNSSCQNCGVSSNEENLVALKEMSWIVTRYGFREAQCYHKCCSLCGNLLPYDGLDDCLLNMGRFLVHYEVLRDYMFQFFHSRSTLSAFYKTMSCHHEDAGNQNFTTSFMYSHFRWSWYCFMRLLDIDYSGAFVCKAPSCGKQPKILLFDGTSLAFQRASLPVVFGSDVDNDEPVFKIKSRYNDRMLIPDKTTRSYLRSFAKSEYGISREELVVLRQKVIDVSPCLLPLLPDAEIHEMEDERFTCNPEFKEFLILLSCDSPLCATFHFSNLHLIAEILKLSPDSELPSSLLNQLQQNIPIFFEIFTKIGYIPKSFFPILDIIQKCVEATFTGDVQSSQVSDQESLPLACYPSMPAVCKRGRYEADCRKPVGSCKKTGARHPSLLPGIFTVFCPHGVCYGFEVMVTAESPNVPFTFLKTRFEQPPEIVIYDNACNLFQYALNRDPAYFKETRFLIDSLHWPNHKKCAAGYEARSYPKLRGINTQIVEQSNAKIRKLKSSLSYMKPENFIDTLKLFLWYSNEQMNKKFD